MNANELGSPTRTVIITQSQPPRKWKSLCSSFGNLIALAALGVLLGGQYKAAAWDVYSDNFDNGNDTSPSPAWLHFDPIHGAFPSYPANTFTCPVDPAGGYNYLLHAAASPSPGTLGPARTIAYRPDIYTNFNITADLLPGWAGGGGIGTDGSYVQGMGLVARLNNVGIGTLNGYGFVYINGNKFPGTLSGFTDNALAIFRIDHEGTRGVPGSGNGSPGDCELHGVTLDNGKAYRFQFIGKGTHLQGRVYELPNTATPIAVLDANTAGDSTSWTNGPCGILGINGSDAAGNPSAGAVDMTWDNYMASIHSPYEIRDDFNRGSDGVQTYPPWSAPAWVEYDPIGGLTAPPSSFTFPSGGYRIQSFAPAVPDAGPARAASFRHEVSYTDFYLSVDLLDWGDTQRQAFGLLARGQSIGLGTTTGYLYSYELGSGTLPNTTGGDTDISGLVAEQADSLPTTSLPPFPNNGSTHFTKGTKYRLTFLGQGAQLTGYVYDLDHGSVVQSWITANDAGGFNYTSGNVGLISASQGNFDVSSDVTFDNFYADTAEPRIAISVDGSGNAVLTWPATLASIWTLQTSSSVAPGAVWTEISGVAAQAISYDSTTGLNTYSTPLSGSASMFFRLQRMDPIAYP